MDSLNIYWVMIGLSMIIILSYLYNYISRISRVPSVILLIFTGFIISIFLPEDFIDLKPFLEILGAIGLIMIVLEASLDLELKKEKAGIMLKAIASAILLLVINALVIAWLIGFFYSVDFTRSLAYALPLAIMSSAIIIPSIQHLSEHRKEFLIYESAFSDIVGIMFFYFLLDSVDTESTGEIALNITGNVLLTLIVSAILGYLVIALIQKVTGQVKLFLPIAVLILLYSVGKLFHLSSLIFILVFGLMINNRELFFKGSLLKLVNTQSFSETLEDLKVLTLESSFVVRTFFFIVFGMTITADGLNDPLVYVIGFGALIVLYASRFGLVPLLTKKEKFPALFIAPRGLITVLLFFSVPESLAIEGFRPAILLLVILASNIVMTYGLMKHKPEETKGESTHGEEVLIPGQEIDLTAPDSSVTAQKTTTEDVD